MTPVVVDKQAAVLPTVPGLVRSRFAPLLRRHLPQCDCISRSRQAVESGPELEDRDQVSLACERFQCRGGEFEVTLVVGPQCGE